MSEQGMIFGCIFAHGSIGSEKSLEFYQYNKKVIETLPERIDWQTNTLVSKDMFTVPMPNENEFYRIQMIHFGASFNHLDYHWETWLSQFEALLKRLFWSETYLYIQAEMFLSHTEYHWKANFSPVLEEPPRTIEEWKFTGGPRTFSDRS